MKTLGTGGQAFAEYYTASRVKFQSSTISDYHMYTLNRRATINENQQKQV